MVHPSPKERLNRGAAPHRPHRVQPGTQEGHDLALARLAEVTVLEVRPDDEYRVRHVPDVRSIARSTAGEGKTMKRGHSWTERRRRQRRVGVLGIVAAAGLTAPLPLDAGVQAEGSTPAASDSIRIGPNVRVSSDLPDIPLAEPHLAISPTEPSRMLAAAIVGGYTGCALFASDDGGGTWGRVQIPWIEGCGDPWLGFGPDGSAYFVVLDGPSNAAVLRSPDGGRTWTGPVLVPGGPYDRPALVVDNTDGPARGTVYLGMYGPTRDAYGAHPIAVALSRSTDGGATFSEPLPLLPTNLRYAFGTLAVLRDGGVIVTFQSYAEPYTRLNLRVRQEFVARYDPVTHAYDRPSFLAEVSHFWGNVSLAVDTSANSPFRDRVYVAHGNTELSQALPPLAEEVMTFMPPGVFVRSSDDRGHTWSAPSVVSGANMDPRQMIAAVNADGALGVAWNQPSEDDETCLEPWFSASRDGGESFLEPVKVPSTTSCPRADVPGNVHEGFDVGGRFPSGGDYMGLVADREGVFHLLWSDSRSGLLQLWTVPIRVEGTADAP